MVDSLAIRKGWENRTKNINLSGLTNKQRKVFDYLCKSHSAYESYKFISKVRVVGISKCWYWKASGTDNGGYGRGSLYKKQMSAHRISYQLFYGDLSNDLVVCHKCDHPSCVNPTHLFQGTQRDNMRDMLNKGRGRTKTHISEKSRKELTKWVSKLYKDGLSVKDIAGLFDLDDNFVDTYLINKAKKKQLSLRRKRVAKMYRYGLKQEKIADVLDINVATVSRDIAFMIKKKKNKDLRKLKWKTTNL